MTTIDAREEARYRLDVLRSYRAWLAYLECQQTILALASEVQAAADPFEGASAAQERADAAQRRLASLPAEQRALFDAVYSAERAQAQRQLDAGAQVRGGTVTPADPDEVARLALAHLLEDAQGLRREDQRGLVPRGTPEAVKWLALDLAEVAHAPPSETDYQLGGGRRDARRGILLNIAMAVLALLAIPLVILLLQPRGQGPTTTGAPTSGGAVLTPWEIIVARPPQAKWEMPVVTAGDDWPASCARQGPEHEQACWRAGTFRPIQLCLPAVFFEAESDLVLDAPDGLPSRVFAITEQPGGDPDLVIWACDVDERTIAPRYGRLREVLPQPSLVPGNTAPGGFRVTAITIHGRGEDPTLAEGQARLTVEVVDGDGQDWVARNPILRLASGDEVLPSTPRSTGTTLSFDYSIPDPVERFAVVWQVAAGADQVVRYRATLEPPASRDAVLRSSLRVATLSVTPSQQTMTVQASLHNTSPVPLVLTPADLGLVTPSTRREVTAPALRQPLAPGETRAVAINLTLESGVLQIGPFQYQLTVRGR